MFRNLIPALADQFHLVAPDYPGFGYSSMPTVDEFDYTFAHLTEVIAGFIDAIDLKRYSLYHDGLWRSYWLSSCHAASRASRVIDCAKWQCLRRRVR
ncbi:alpha/beta fold hydrolase [Leptolyngbya sp. Cla-17]|uniref:alpha/beta fold hydrolase n=1 Tax=Leptolyngbya sp. Cla-17 TaxID=2803751 RepID=UPI001F5DA5E7